MIAQNEYQLRRNQICRIINYVAIVDSENFAIFPTFSFANFHQLIVARLCLVSALSTLCDWECFS